MAPFGYSGFWLPKADYWTELMRSMGVEVALVCSDGDGGLRACEVLLDAGIQPVIRFTPSDLPHPFPHMAHVETFVRMCHSHGVEAIVQAGNEPADSREWVGGKTPKDWLSQFLPWWSNAARIIIERGGTAGFPDAPGYSQNPFPTLPAEWWSSGTAIFLGHFYGLNRPPDYPRDDVSLNRTPLTEAEHRKWLGPFYDVPGWREPLDKINQQRAAWPYDPNDATCWRGWEQVQKWMVQTFGKPVRMALTEGGWTPGATAGGYPNIDIRYPKPTPDTVARWTMDALQVPDCPMEFQAFWLLADSLMGGSGGWDGDAWVTGAYRHLGYGIELPVVQALQGSEPPPEPPPPDDELRFALERVRERIDTALRLLAPV